MLHENATPFAALGFEQWHRDGPTMGVVTVRGRYILSEDDRLCLADDQQIVFGDEYQGGPSSGCLVRTGDIVPHKPSADITAAAKSYPIIEDQAASWECGIRVAALKYIIRCYGRRYWEPKPRRRGEVEWRLSEPELSKGISLDYRAAGGGRVVGDPQGSVSHFNPLGRGILHPRYTPTDQRYEAPSVDSEAAPILDPFTEVEPQGFAPIPPFWKSRLQHAGTFDDGWLEERHPRLPKDFDYRFYQSAHPSLVYPGYLSGEETVAVAGLTADRRVRRFTLPRANLMTTFQFVGGQSISLPMNLDGLHLDFRNEGELLVELTWRCWIALDRSLAKADVAMKNDRAA